MIDLRRSIGRDLETAAGADTGTDTGSGLANGNQTDTGIETESYVGTNLTMETSKAD